MHSTKFILHASHAVLLVTTLVLSAGCTDSAPQNQAKFTPDNDAAVMAAIKAANAPARPRQNQGVVKTVKMAGGYTYALVDIGGDDFWLATTMTTLRSGQAIAWQDYAIMKNFRSKALDQEFDQILFVDRLIDAAATAQHRGTVTESMNAAGYSFIRVDENGQSLWLATPETSIGIGQSIQWHGGAQMLNFTSRALNRVFDKILFVGAVHAS